MRRGRVLLGFGLLAAAACPPPKNVTPLIHVDPRAAGRAGWLARPVESVDRAPAPARVHVMKDGQQLGGPNAVGRPGDLILENDEVVFVIDQLGSSVGFAESGGDIVDAADARARKDELGQVFTYFGKFPRQGVYDSLSSGVADDGSAWAEATGRELYESKISVTTRYTLHAPDRALLLETAVENTGSEPVTLPALGDAVLWGGAEKVAPGKPQGFKGPSSGPYVGGVGRFTSYAITSRDGVLDATSGGAWTDTSQRKDVALAPGDKAAYARIFVVGPRADTSSLVGELAMAAGAPVGEIAADVPREAELPTGFSLVLRAEGSQETLTLAPPFVANVPVGRYRVADPASRSRSAAGPVDVKAGERAPEHIEVPVDPAGSLEVRCVGPDLAPTPCKVTFEGVGSTPSPAFGVAHAAGPARNQATTATGSVQVLLAAGKYHVTTSRGPEYALAVADVDLAPGERAVRTLAPTRVVDTSGYLACDFHQHTMLGTDAPVATRDRIVANVAEGVEIAVATEHNLVVDLEPLVKEMRLDRELVSVSGDELTSDASRVPWGHANAFPMPFDAGKPRGGAPLVRDRPAHDVFEEIRGRAGGEVVIQVNHPRAGSSGYFDLLGFDDAKGVGSGAGYDATFDALEVWNGRHLDGRAKTQMDFLALLRTGHPVTPTADTDTHGIVGQEAGYPRTYVRVGDDAHLAAWDAARTADLVSGIKTRRDVVLTNGPMLRVTAGGAPMGGLALGRSIEVKVHVESAPWVEVDEVRVLRASAPEKPETKAIAQKRGAGGALSADVTFSLRLSSDDAIVVVASGTRPMAPVLGGDSSETLPWAMTGAIWLDADGDGAALGRRRHVALAPAGESTRVAAFRDSEHKSK